MSIVRDAAKLLEDCIHDEAWRLVETGRPIEYGGELTRVARVCAETLHADGLLHGGGADSIEKQRRIIVELRRRLLATIEVAS